MRLTISKKDRPEIRVWISALLLLFTFSNVSAQVLITGTEFDPLPGNGDRYYIGIKDIAHYGLQPGIINTGTPLAEDVDEDNFHPEHQYAIADNPIKVDSNRYNDIDPDLDYQIIFSPATEATNIIEYRVTGLEPNSSAMVRVRYCNPMSPDNPDGCDGIVSLRGSLNREGAQNGAEHQPQLRPGICGEYEYSDADGASNPVDGNGNLVFRLNTMQHNECTPIAIQSIEIYGIPKPVIFSADGDEVCAGENVTIRSRVAYNGSYQWQIGNNGNFSDIPGATGSSYSHETSSEGDYEFRLVVTDEDGNSFNSEPITVGAIKCCEIDGAPASRQTIFYDNFGRWDMSDPDGGYFYVWDYSDIENPQEVRVEADAPFRMKTNPEPWNTTFKPTGAPIDGEYTVAANLRNQDFGYWAHNITGYPNDNRPTVGYDRSGEIDGGVLLINCPPNSKGETLYEREFNNLCGSGEGRLFFFECYITVFSHDQYGVDVTVILTDGGNPDNIVEINQTAHNRSSGGNTGWVRVAGQIELEGDALEMKIINNLDQHTSGNDLAIDDISISTCAPPSVSLFFDDLSVHEEVCEDDTLRLLPQVTDMINNFYSGNQEYLFQWTKTPDDYTSWQNIGGPVTDPEHLMEDVQNHTPFADLADEESVYFRVVVANPGTFTETGNFQNEPANINNPCRNYSVSEAIEATLVPCVLPVELVTFTGFSKEIGNKLLWETATEINNNYFVIERMSEGNGFEAIGRVNGKGNSFTLVTYEFLDKTPANGINYYRLKQVDYDGTSAYSKTIALNSERADINMFPNPNNGTFSVSVSIPDQSYRLDIIDASGKVIYNSNNNSSEIVEVNDIPKGFYLVRLHTNNNVVTKKLIVH